MDSEIKRIVDKCQIHEKRTELIYTKERMIYLDRAMATLTFNREVGLYAYKLDEKERLLQTKENKEKIAKINYELSVLENNLDILKYRFLREEYNKLKETLGEYQKSINIDLRNELKNIELPNSYIYQEDHGIHMDRHIINPLVNKVVLPELSKGNSIVIYPSYEITSNRDFRHFYNKISFKYLEMLTNDYNFDINNKHLNKIKIKNVKSYIHFLIFMLLL